MSKKPTEKSTPKGSPNAALKYSGIAFQLAAILALGIYIGQKLDAHFATEKPYLTALCTLIALPVAFYVTLKDFL